jgi:hypothetical protein
VRIFVEAPDLDPGRTRSHAVASYVRAAIKVHALRRELAAAMLEMRRCRQTLFSRAHAEALMAEVHMLCAELQIDPENP